MCLMLLRRLTYPILLVGVLSSFALAEPPMGSKRTALDDYVAKEDSTYQWKL